MTHLRTDPTVDAQVRSQVAQQLTAELAVPCPDCGVEAGRSCRDSLDRAVRTHLARSVAANRRDTEPCPGPSESLERASAREFAESMRGERPSFTRWRCPKCSRVTETRPLFKIDCCTGHEWTAMVPTLLDGTDQTPTAPERAPAIAPEAVHFHGPSISEMVSREPGCQCHWEVGDSPCRVHGENEEDQEPPHPVCACGQTVWNELTVCGDCRAENVSALLCMPQPAPLDKRVREAQSDDATECAWSTPTSDGEGWT